MTDWKPNPYDDDKIKALKEKVKQEWAENKEPRYRVIASGTLGGNDFKFEDEYGEKVFMDMIKKWADDIEEDRNERNL